MPKRPSSLETAAPLIPESPTLDKLRDAAAGCRAFKREDRHAQLKAFIEDLRVVAEVLQGMGIGEGARLHP
jgi:hypothetical protein